jgi:hypothetical protein
MEIAMGFAAGPRRGRLESKRLNRRKFWLKTSTLTVAELIQINYSLR